MQLDITLHHWGLHGPPLDYQFISVSSSSAEVETARSPKASKTDRGGGGGGGGGGGLHYPKNLILGYPKLIPPGSPNQPESWILGVPRTATPKIDRDSHN
jgi:hypothetical protein